ncbi:MAG: hypothetical protein O8C64_15000 [Candidatus Methanoperedens sp.]|nr:hypothetical protein [Candidatus Methanoperedens sp.]MCZ7404183.1 hypothetical protein [Candidatus Methanoperedens sp.]
MNENLIVPKIFKKYHIEKDEIFSVLKGELDVGRIIRKDIQKQMNFKSSIAIVDVQGRDSFAASILGFENLGIKRVIPVIVYNQVQYGDWNALLDNVKLLKNVIKKRFDGVVFQPIVIGDPEYWWILNGRYVSEIIQKFGFYSPCLNCHLYIHSMRSFLAKAIGCNTIISGERESHDGKYKINQLPISIDFYSNLLKNFGIEHINPLRHMATEYEINKIVKVDWTEGTKQPKCVFSSNYVKCNGTTQFDIPKIEKFFTEFSVPVVEKFFEYQLNFRDRNDMYLQLNEYIKNTIFNRS